MNHDEIEHLAHRRAAAKLGWYVHALVFVGVNLLLAAWSGRHWGLFTAAGWGIGLVAHALVVFIALPGGTLHALLLQRERAALAASRDPW